MRRKLIDAAAVVLISALGVTSSALAWVPPSGYMVKHLAQKRLFLKTLKVRSMIVGMEGGVVAGTHFRQTTWLDSASGTLLSWASDDQDRKLYIAVRKVATLSPFPALLFSTDVEHNVATLKDRKIPVLTDAEVLALPDEFERRAAEKTHFVRHKGGLYWVVGDQSGSGPGLWVQKESLLPLRLLYSRADDGVDVDLEMDQYRFVRDFGYPHLVTVARKGATAPELREEWLDVEANENLGKWPTGLRVGFTDIGNSAPSPVRDLILEYYRTLR